MLHLPLFQNNCWHVLFKNSHRPDSNDSPLESEVNVLTTVPQPIHFSAKIKTTWPAQQSNIFVMLHVLHSILGTLLTQQLTFSGQYWSLPTSTKELQMFVYISVQNNVCRVVWGLPAKVVCTFVTKSCYVHLSIFCRLVIRRLWKKVYWRRRKEEEEEEGNGKDKTNLKEFFLNIFFDLRHNLRTLNILQQMSHTSR